ncbi:MAG: QueT transporter family protein [Clostridium sp.]|uniref:QueT transporter family protein n=1 Tax=Clostridium sp. TaxID=1506 RepID=UPI0029128481|nr:QueT transporter family protein [Clostridium sp.]MDU7338658.1 QueT transporter family protein [Clostridium sp.]
MKTTVSRRTVFLVQGAMIAALYVVLTFLSSAMGLAYGPVQFRLSEALTILPVFTPAAIPGITIGCLISNLGSPYGVVDILCGTGATLLAAVISYQLRRFRLHGLPVLSALPPVLCNALVIGAELAFFLPSGFTAAGFFAAGVSVGAGELVVLAVLGLPLAFLLEKSGTAQKLFNQTGY